MTWACERFADFLIGKDFQIETDHKPLVPLLTSKNLDELPVRIQRYCMRLMWFQFTATHIPGSDLKIADALSRAPLQENRNRQTITGRYQCLCCSSYRRNASNSKKDTGYMPSSGARQHLSTVDAYSAEKDGLTTLS